MKQRNFPIFDGHNDTLVNLHLPERGKGRSFFVRSEVGHIDLPRAREAGYSGGVFAVYVPACSPASILNSDVKKSDSGILPRPDGSLDVGYARDFTIAVVARLLRLEAESGGQVKIVRNVDEILDCFDKEILAVVLHFEGAEAIDSDLNMLEVFYQVGLRSLGITWSRPNVFGWGVESGFPSSPDTGAGLTDSGRRLVRRCNQLGIMLDVSHLNEKGFWEVAGLSEAPLVASHSAAHALCASARNLTDRQLDAIAESDGIVGVNFYPGFLRADGRSEPDTCPDEIIRHMDYIVQRIGIEHVGLGTDFDGAEIPLEIKDVTGLPKIISALEKIGYDESSLAEIAYKNWVRVLRKTWQ